MRLCLCCKALLGDLVNTDIFILLGTENLKLTEEFNSEYKDNYDISRV